MNIFAAVIDHMYSIEAYHWIKVRYILNFPQKSRYHSARKSLTPINKDIGLILLVLAVIDHYLLTRVSTHD